MKATFTELSSPSLLFRCVCCCCPLYLVLGLPATAVTPVLATGQTGQKECFGHRERAGLGAGFQLSVQVVEICLFLQLCFFSSLYILFNLSIHYYFMIRRLGMALNTWACLSICTSSSVHRYRALGILQAFSWDVNKLESHSFLFSCNAGWPLYTVLTQAL